MNSSAPSPSNLQSPFRVQLAVRNGGLTVTDHNVTEFKLDQICQEIGLDGSSNETDDVGLIGCFALGDETMVTVYSSFDSNSELTLDCYLSSKDRFVDLVSRSQLHSATFETCSLRDAFDDVEPIFRSLVNGRSLRINNRTPQDVVPWLWQFLPPSCWTELTFSTFPLKSHSQRLYFVPGDASASGRADVSVDVMLGEPEGDVSDSDEVLAAWSLLIDSHLRIGGDGMTALEKFFDQRCSAATLSDLETIALKWCCEPDLSSSGFDSDNRSVLSDHSKVQIGVRTEGTAIDFRESAVLDKLGQLDDAVFDAIAGCPEGLRRMKELWPQAYSEVSVELLEESREHYMRYIVNEWTQRFGGENDRVDTSRAIEIIRILFGDSSGCFRDPN